MTSIDHALWRRLSPLLDEVLDLEAEGRAARIAALRAEDPALADELETLLRESASAEAEKFLESAASIAAAALSVAEPSLEGTRIGAYVIESLLGQGGSGSVWSAHRADERIGGRVAIKLLHLSMLGHAGVPRFEREGGILARLTHPHIARFLDAGVTPGGQPFLVLDLVSGEPIDRYCDERRLDVDRRLALFDDVLAAVAHAHSHLVVHRDIKPSNILVEADGTVKLLDFGIAKLLEEGAEGVTLTAEGQRALTPQYAAPEQLLGAPVTTATDIYALGVLLYQLLVGQHPTSGGTTSYHEAMRATLDAEPTPLSRALTVTGTRPEQAIVEIASVRGTTPARLHGKVHGDLENIVARMLRKDPAERYQTVAALAEDLRRYRANEPVSARADAWGYRFAKFVRRHRGMVAATTVVLLSLAAGLAGTITQARRAEANAAQAQLERDNAVRQLSYAESSNEFITFLLDQGGPDKAFTMAELLARGEELVNQQFADDPATRARLQMHLSGLHAQAGQERKATELLDRARQAAQAVVDPTLHALIDCALAWQASERGSGEQALQTIDQALARLQEAADRETGRAVRAECQFTRGQVQFARGEAQAATADLQAALATLGRPRTDQRTLAIRIRSTLALAWHRVGQPATAIAEYERVLAELDAMGRGRTQLVAALSNNLGVLLFGAGQTQRARQASERALDIVRGTGRPDPVLQAVYAKLLSHLGQAREAVPLAEQAIADARATGNERVKLIALQNGAVTFCAVADFARCDALLAEAHAAMARTTPAGAAIASIQMQQGELALARGHPREAVRVLSTAVAGFGAPPQPGTNAVQTLVLLARAEALLGDLPSAQAHAEQAVDAARKGMAGFPHSRWLGSALAVQGLVQRARGDLEAAQATWRAALGELIATDGETAPLTDEVRRLLGGA
jgi:eukaryotic-like serine/threonine-protein kinase